jgi:hypothetical protein
VQPIERAADKASVLQVGAQSPSKYHRDNSFAVAYTSGHTHTHTHTHTNTLALTHVHAHIHIHAHARIAKHLVNMIYRMEWFT